MEFTQAQILDRLTTSGKHDDAKKADQEMPDKVDTNRTRTSSRSSA
jgi:hypothetical protein